MDAPKKALKQDHDQAAQAELINLERQFRAMQKDQQACPERTRAILSKQQKLIKLLEQEKQQLLEEIACSNTKPQVKAQQKTAQEILKLISDHEELGKEIEKNSCNLNDLQSQIKIVKNKIQGIKKDGVKVEVSADEIAREERADENLESRLHVEAIKFNKQMMDNAALRQQIQDLLHERERFSRHFKMVSTELATGKKIICDLIEQGNVAFKQRKDAEVKLNALKTKAKHDLLNNCSEAQKLQMQVDHGLKLNQFIGKKSQRRVSEVMEKERVEKEEKAVQNQMDYFNNYSGIVNDIKDRFGETDLDQLVTQFIKLEQDNYNIYSFINEINKKLDAMRDEVCVLHSQIQQQRGLNQTNGIEWEKIIDDLEQEVSSKQKLIVVSRETLHQSKEHVDTLLSGIQDIFNTVSCDPRPIRQMLGKNASVTPDNVFLYLKSLEERLQEVSTVASYQQQRTTPRKSRSIRSVRSFANKMAQPKTVLPGSPCPLCAEARDVSEVDESVAVPMDTAVAREQLRQQLKKGDRSELVHSVSECRLTKSRRIIQKRQN